MLLNHRQSNLSWEVTIVYGAADHRRSATFLLKLKTKLEWRPITMGVGEDFNLIHSHEDKNSANVDLPQKLFNNWMADLAPREITSCVGARYTWNNNHVDPIQSVLDRVLVSLEWEVSFPLAAYVRLPELNRTTPPPFLEEGSVPYVKLLPFSELLASLT